MSLFPRVGPHARPRVRRTALAAGALVLALTASACGGSSGSASSSGTLRMLGIQDSTSLDPFRTSYIPSTDEPRLEALYDALLTIDPKTGTIQPKIAESLTTTDSGTTWTLKLRPGVKFSDGTPFDAAAVKTTWETHAKPETRSVHAAYAAGLTLDVLDPLTLKITPPTPNANFDRTVATHLTYIEAPSAIAKGIDSAGANPVGAGPFTLKQWIRGSKQVFAANPTYWQHDKGLPKLKEITFGVVPDREQEKASIVSGGADMMVAGESQVLAEASKDKNLQVMSQTDTGGQMIMFNTTRPPFDDVRARRAVALAIDPADIPTTLGNDLVPAKGVFNQSSPFFDPAHAQPSPDKAQAQALFDQLAAEGKKVDFTYLIPANPVSQRTAEYMQSRLTAFRNVSVKIDALQIGAYIPKYAIQKDFQATLFQQWYVDPEPEMFNTFSSQSVSNFSGWKSAAADQALLAGRASSDPAVRKQAYSDLQKVLADELPVFVYGESPMGPIASTKVTGITLYNSGAVFTELLDLK